MKRTKKTGSARNKTRRVKYAMHLYVTGATPKSSAAITNLRKLCDDYLPGEYELKVIDIYQRPELAREGRLIAAPTLVKSLPLPLRRFIGDMSNTKDLLAGLEICPVPPAKSSGKSPEA
jgi:circadian clock protein KaiB